MVEKRYEVDKNNMILPLQQWVLSLFLKIDAIIDSIHLNPEYN
jgi:hypothetical protein